MKINILDAGIRYHAGHHYDYGLKLVKHYAEAGHDVHVYGFAKMTDEVEADFARFAKVTRLFSTFPYHSPSEYDWFAGELARLRTESSRIAGELEGVRDAEVWIWPTMRPPEIEACAARGVKTPLVGCVYWDPGVESGSIDAQLWRHVLLFAQERGLALTLASVEAELRHRFMRIVPDGRFALLPHPVDGPPIAERKSALKRIGFFGHQREEKGARMIRSLLSQLVEDGYAITFHNSDKEYPFPDVEGIDRLDYVEDIAVPISACDLVVLPYDVKRYQARGSGILMECLALGIPVTAPLGTLPGRIVEQAGVGPLFRISNVNPIYGAIKSAERNYGIFATNAHRHATRFCNHNGVERFGSALLAAAAVEA
jgi:hypothetical protein